MFCAVPDPFNTLPMKMLLRMEASSWAPLDPSSYSDYVSDGDSLRGFNCEHVSYLHPWMYRIYSHKSLSASGVNSALF